MKPKGKAERQPQFWTKLIGITVAVAIIMILVFSGVQNVVYQIAEMHLELDTAKSELDEAQRQLNEKSSELGEVSSQLAESNRELGEKSSALDTTQSELAAKSSELTETRTKLAQAQSQLAESQDELDKKSSELQVEEQVDVVPLKSREYREIVFPNVKVYDGPGTETNGYREIDKLYRGSIVIVVDRAQRIPSIWWDKVEHHARAGHARTGEVTTGWISRSASIESDGTPTMRPLSLNGLDISLVPPTLLCPVAEYLEEEYAKRHIEHKMREDTEKFGQVYWYWKYRCDDDLVDRP